MKNYAIFATLLCLAACGGQSGPDIPPTAEPTPVGRLELTTGTWVVKYSATAKGIRSMPPTSATYTLDFALDGAVSGLIDCNLFTSAYSVDGDALVVDPPQVDTAACPEAHQEATATVITTLTEAARFSLRGGELVVHSNSGSHLALEQQHSGCDQPLAITGEATGPANVLVTSEANAGEIVAELEASRPDFVLRDYGDCTNTFSASINSNTLSMLRCRDDIKSISF